MFRNKLLNCKNTLTKLILKEKVMEILENAPEN